MPEKNRNINRANTNRRISLVIISFLLLLAVVAAKLFSVQVINSSKYRIAAKKQYEKNIPLLPTRGIIYDRKFNALVTNTTRITFAADPNMIDNKDSVAEVFARIFQKDKSYYLDKLNAKNTSFVWLERRIDPVYDSLVKDINITGVIKQNESERTKNYGSVASQVIGVTNIDNKGISGMELECEEELAGTEGYVVMQKDGLGKKRPALEYPRVDPVNGNSIVLTIDLDIQKIIEEELKAGIDANNAEGGKCLIMSVKTGEILGMYSYRNQSITGSERDYGKMSVITDMYEPGSTFKIVTAAACLEESLENKNSIVQTNGGEYKFYDITIKDSHKSSSLTFQQVIEQSSNVGVVKSAEKLGSERFYKYARDFGFGITSGIDYPGEIKGMLKKPVEYTNVSLRFSAIGYEVLVNTLQMTNAYACIANNGVLMKPYIIKKELTPDNRLIFDNQPTKLRTVVSPSTAGTLIEFLYGVVERGTGTEAKIDGMKIAGKTGTAQKLVNGEYSKTFYTSSFIGFFPADNPQIVVAVIVDAPMAGQIYGGKVAAPVFKKIAERIIQLTGLNDGNNVPFEKDSHGILIANNSGQDINQDNREIKLDNMDVEDAAYLLTEKNLEFDIEGPVKNSIVKRYKNVTDEDGKVKLVILETIEKKKQISGNLKENIVIMPDLNRMSLRNAIKTVTELGLDFNITGNGIVIAQKPDPGSQIINNQKISIICQEVKTE